MYKKTSLNQPLNENKCLLLAIPHGFCAGVKRAVTAAETALQQFAPPVYCLNEIVHNRQVVAQLESHGMVFINDIKEAPNGSVLLFSAHGVAPEVREMAAAKNLTVIDATCPFVDKLHQKVRDYAADHYHILLIGKHGHDEVVGVAGEAPELVTVIATEQEAREVRVLEPERLAALTQTTLSEYETDAIKRILVARFPKIQFPKYDGICYATRNRQAAVQAIAQHAEMIVVLGSPNSSNSMRLVEVAQAGGTQAALISELAELKAQIPATVRCLGLTAGASVPEDFINKAVDLLRTHGFNNTQSISSAEEDVAFPLPQSLLGPRLGTSE